MKKILLAILLLACTGLVADAQSCPPGFTCQCVLIPPPPPPPGWQIADNSWIQLSLGATSRYLNSQSLYAIDANQTAEPNPRNREYSGVIAGNELMFYFGGGHSGYPGNDIEIFDPGTIRWEQSYRPEFCPYITTEPCYRLYQGLEYTEPTPLGRPYTEHSYQIYAYNPGDHSLLGLLMSGTWKYDIATKSWTRLLDANASLHSFGGKRHVFSFDPGLNAIQAAISQGDRVYRWDGQQWIARGYLPDLNWTTLYSTYAPDRALHYVYSVNWTQKWWSYAAVTDTWTPLLDPPLVPDSFDYDQINHVIIAVHSTGTTAPIVMVYDPVTNLWTIQPTAVGPNIPLTGTGGMMRLRHLPSQNAFVLIMQQGSLSTRTWAYRYKNASMASLSPADASFSSRCAQPGVVRCIGFDTQDSITPFITSAGNGQSTPSIDTCLKASGSGALKMTIPSRSPADTSGTFSMNFTPGSLNQVYAGGDPEKGLGYYPTQFGEGQEFYIQWRQRLTKEFITTRYAGGGGFKQVVIGEGDRSGFKANSCTQLELAVHNNYYRGFPQMYHSCGGKDGQYEPIIEQVGNDWKLQNAIQGCLYSTKTVPPCVGYKPNQWMTFQVHVRPGTWYKNDKTYHRDSLIELWVAEEGKPSVKVISISNYDLANQNSEAKYGKIWLMPYNTGKDPLAFYPETYTWYDELIISKNHIADP